MTWHRMIFAAALCLSLPALALADGADADCAAVLAAPPFVDMLTRNEGRDFQEINSVYGGQALSGLECSIEELTDFFENAGWEFLGYEEWRRVGRGGGNGGIPEYHVDASASFCLKRPTILGMFGFRCRPLATISFFKGQVSHIIAHMSK